jgi:dTMP kinase
MFVVFEGIDGSGKTTVSNRVADRLREGGLKVRHLRADGKFASEVTEALRSFGRDARHLDLVPQAEFLLYVARDVQLIEQVLRPALAVEDVVISDRFLYTPEVLGRTGRNLDVAFTAPILRAAAGGLTPDLVVLVDVDPVLARARRKAFKLSVLDKRPPGRKGLAGAGLQHRMRGGYLELADASPRLWAVVDNEDVLEDTVARVATLISEARRDGTPAAVGRFRAAISARRRAAGADHARQPGSPAQALRAFLALIDKRMEREPGVAAYLLGGLAGPGIDERRQALAERVPDAVLAALTMLTDDASFGLRERLSAVAPAAAARSLVGIPSSDARASSLRAALEPVAPADVALSLSRLDDQAAWQARERLFDVERCADVVMASLGALASERAWGLRERWLAGLGGKIEDKIEAHYELASAATKSIWSLDDERAWRLRRAARPAAPVAALASVVGLDDPESWSWRRDMLARAPKVVMATLRELDRPEAWRMRQQVAAECKEALDGIEGMDQPEAWTLREQHADRWPSTVVKSLGPLADGTRGNTLLLRQLDAHGSNVSLLKHSAAVALGLHRARMPKREGTS